MVNKNLKMNEWNSKWSGPSSKQIPGDVIPLSLPGRIKTRSWTSVSIYSWAQMPRPTQGWSQCSQCSTYIYLVRDSDLRVIICHPLRSLRKHENRLTHRQCGMSLINSTKKILYFSLENLNSQIGNLTQSCFAKQDIDVYCKYKSDLWIWQGRTL